MYRLIVILYFEGVLQSFSEQTSLCEPLNRPLVELIDFLFLVLIEAQSQKFSKKMMVTEPAAFIIQRDNEKIGLLKLPQDLMTVPGLNQFVTDFCTEAVQNGGAPQELLDVRSLAGENFIDKIIRQERWLPLKA